MPLPSLSNNNENKKPDKNLPSIEKEIKETLPQDLPDFDDFEEVDLSEDARFKSIDDGLDDDYYEEPEPIDDSRKIKKPQERGYDSPFADEVTEESEKLRKNKSRYIDRKNKKIKPTGGERSIRKVKAKEFDDRKNPSVTAKVVRILLSVVIIFLIGLGVKNTFFPEQIYTPQEIDMLVKNSMGETGFPLERGKQFVEEFTKELLSTDRSDSAANARLARFVSDYENSAVSAVNFPFLTVRSGSQQRVLSDPTVYEYDTIAPYLGRYRVTTLVSDDDGEDSAIVNNNKIDKSHWVTLYMNVFYDTQKNTMSIIKDTVTLLPPYAISTDSDLPRADVIGTGEEDKEATEKLRPTINGFFSAFASASQNSHEEILQYIVENPDPSLYQGFGGNVTLAGSPSESINFIVYKSENSNEWRVLSTVRWKDAKTSKQSIEYVSKYVLTILQFEEKTLVSRVVPYTYVMSPDEN